MCKLFACIKKKARRDFVTIVMYAIKTCFTNLANIRNLLNIYTQSFSSLPMWDIDCTNIVYYDLCVLKDIFFLSVDVVILIIKIYMTCYAINAKLVLFILTNY